MLAKVADYHVATGPGDTGPANVVGGKALRQSLVQAAQLVETGEYFRVTSRICAASGDDVTPVLAVLACRAEELAFLGQRRADGFLQV